MGNRLKMWINRASREPREICRQGKMICAAFAYLACFAVGKAAEDCRTPKRWRETVRLANRAKRLGVRRPSGALAGGTAASEAINNLTTPHPFQSHPPPPPYLF